MDCLFCDLFSALPRNCLRDQALVGDFLGELAPAEEFTKWDAQLVLVVAVARAVDHEQKAPSRSVFAAWVRKVIVRIL